MRCISIDEAIQRVAAKSGLPVETVRSVLQAQAEVAYASAEEGYPVPGIGTFGVFHRRRGIARNPATGDTIRVPAKSMLKFRVAQIAKRVVLDGSQEAGNVLSEELSEEEVTPDD